MKKNRKLKNYILFPKIQLKFVILSIVTTLVAVGAFLFQVHASFSDLNLIGKKIGLKEGNSFFKLLEAQESIIIKNSLIAFVLVLIISVVLNFLMTHRALGPFYRLKVFFKGYSKGSGDKIRFRDTDYFKELEDDINKALE